MGLFSKLKEGLAKTRQGFVAKIDTLVSGGKKIDEELYEEIEELLIQADIGVNTAIELVEDLKKNVKERKVEDSAQLRNILKELIADLMGEEQKGLVLKGKPAVIVVVGVNGVGKTTTIGKLAYNFKEQGRKVLFAAGDTFRAAAIDQLQIWAGRVGCDIIKHNEGSDTAAVVYDAIQAAKAREVDILIVDTAGRLHTKTNLMEELKKLFRVISRELPDSPDEVLLVLDATTGQNAISQAKIFGEAAGVSGIVLTKLDGTAKGGVVIGIKSELNIPVKYVGVGEKIDDLREFNPKEFVEALFED
ncbi:signal recognition particle-docking protein FtsY [Phosphitispora sp. TUW77]|uniref:signal recognition particle-docking protein FtsY n=1 Tax=Phosphitispora sp. TUW77 TaxID=3152361 RepID=UPI003AB851D8